MSSFVLCIVSNLYHCSYVSSWFLCSLILDIPLVSMEYVLFVFDLYLDIFSITPVRDPYLTVSMMQWMPLSIAIEILSEYIHIQCKNLYRTQMPALKTKHMQYNDVIMSAIASQITSLTIIYSAVYSGAYQRKHQSSATLAFVWGIHRWPVNSPHTWPVTRKMFPFDDVIMYKNYSKNWKDSLGTILGIYLNSIWLL